MYGWTSWIYWGNTWLTLAESLTTLIVDLDHSQEWLNGRPYWKERMWHCRQKSALPRPPFRDGPFRSISEHTSAQTRQMLNVGDGNAIPHSKATPARIKTQRDNSVQSNIVRIQAIAWRYRNTSRYSHHLMGPLNLFTVLQLKTLQPLKSESPVLAWKSLDSHSCIHLMKKGW